MERTNPTAHPPADERIYSNNQSTKDKNKN
jgi:hypothetical protein